jgi:nitroimidazol reductase NimA-like FMN-containing flavoprotein (pyridoxamine 5'-phosphate oxidase superfamily)
MKTYSISDTSLMETLIKKCKVCYVGLSDEDGMPYVLPMNFGYSDGILYLHSGPEGKSIDIIRKNPKACVTFCPSARLAHQHEDVACSYRMKSESVMCFGEIVFEEDVDKKTDALNHIMAQYSERAFSYSLPAVKNVQVWIMKVEHMSGKIFGEKHNLSF